MLLPGAVAAGGGAAVPWSVGVDGVGVGLPLLRCLAVCPRVSGAGCLVSG